MAHLLGLVKWCSSLHGGLVRCLLGVLQLNVVCDVVGLPSQEVLLKLLGIDHTWEVPLHLSLSLE